MRAKILIQTFRQMFCFLHGWPFRASGVALTPRCHAHRGVKLYCTYDDLPITLSLTLNIPAHAARTV